MTKPKKIEIIFKNRVKYNGKRYEAGTKIKVDAEEKERWLKAGAKIVSKNEVATGADGKVEPVEPKVEKEEVKKEEFEDGNQE